MSRFSDAIGRMTSEQTMELATEALSNLTPQQAAEAIKAAFNNVQLLDVIDGITPADDA